MPLWTSPTQSTLASGSWNLRRLSGFLGDLQLSCGDLPKLCGASVAIPWDLQLSYGDLTKALWCLSDDFLGASN
jgi:hypothetical protein